MKCEPEAIRARRLKRMSRVAAMMSVYLLALHPAAHAGQGNRYVGELSTLLLPPDLPAFLRERASVLDAGELTREPDRMRGAGSIYDAQHDADHFLALDSSGHTRTGLSINAFPETREAYVNALFQAGTTPSKEGASIYATAETWQLLREHFAYWRVMAVARKAWKDPRQQAWLDGEMRRRRFLILATIGNFGHLAGDVRAPLHVSIDRDGWVGPNPRNYTTGGFRRYAEGELILKYVSQGSVRHAMPPLSVCPDPIMKCLAAGVTVALAGVEPFYQLATEGGFAPGDKRGIAFMTIRTAEQAAFTRDLIVKAWRDSAQETIGYTSGKLKISDVEAGKAPTFEQLHGWD